MHRIASPAGWLLLLVVATTAPGAATALTIPLDSASTFVGVVDSELLGPGRTDGHPNGPGVGSIVIDGELAPNSTVQITELTLIQRFSFGYACTGSDGYYCLPSEQLHDVFLRALEGPGSIAIDGEGQVSGELHVFVGLDGVVSFAATLLVNVLGYPITPGALILGGTLQFDPESPLASLQGVALVPEPSPAALVVVSAVAALGGWRRRRA